MKLPGKSVFVMLGATILAAACLGFGSWGSHKSSNRGTEVTFVSTTKLKDGTTLPAGTYRMEVPENSQTPKVTFYKDGKVEATVNAKLVDEGTKSSTTEVDSVTQGDTQELTSIRPGGWHEKIVFESNGM